MFKSFSLRLLRKIRVWNFYRLFGMTLLRMGKDLLKGDIKGAAQVMAAAVGLEVEDFQDPTKSLAKIRQRLADIDPNTAMRFFTVLTTIFVMDNKHDWVASVYELDTGLKPEDYAESESVTTRLKQRVRDLSPSLGCLYGVRLGTVLGLADRSKDELIVLETLVGVEQSDYRDPSRLRQILGPRSDVSQEIWASAVQALAASLGTNGRRAEVLAVLEAAADISISDYSEPELLKAKITKGVGPLGTRIGYGFSYSILLSKGLQDSGRYAESISVLETQLGLEPADYENIPLLAAKLKACFGGAPPELGVCLVPLFVVALNAAQRHQDGLAVLSADVGFDITKVEMQELICGLQTHCASSPDSIIGLYLGTASYTLAVAGFPAEAVTIFEIDSALSSEFDWQNIPALATRIRERIGDLAPFVQILYVGSLVSALQEADQEEKAALLTNAFLQYVSPIETVPHDSGLMATYCHFYDDWLRWWGKDAQKKPLDESRRLLPFLRQVIAEQGIELADRERFIQSVSDLRRRILETGFYWVGKEAESAETDALRKQVFLWDLELAQRLLIERFMLTEPYMPTGGEPIPESSGPFPEDSPATENRLSQNSPIGAVIGNLENAPKEIRENLEQTQPHPARSRLGDLIPKGLDEAALAKSLGSQGLLLRVTFDSDGRLIWGALRSNEGLLDLARFGTGKSQDLLRLRWAIARYDFSMSLLRWIDSAWPFTALLRAARRALPSALQHLATAENLGSSQIEGILEVLATQLPAGKGLSSLLRLCRLLTWPLEEHGEDPFASHALHLAEQFAHEAFRQRPSRGTLDALTARYLSEIRQIWDFSHLEPLLTQKTNLVIQADDALHAVPVAWLPISDGEPLYSRVHTVRTSLAPQLDTLLDTTTGDDTETRRDDRRLLSVSYFGPEDDIRKDTLQLHQGHRDLARHYGGISHAGADGSGTVGAIQATLERHRSFAVVTICGHGDHARAGIQLGDGHTEPTLWYGQGCDFSGVDLLLLISCSIGRVSRTGDLDVEGFCVQLSIHRARSILACRWPVSSTEAIAFANEVVRQYLALEGRSGRRGLALTAARRALCEGEELKVGLNTAAAFELFGLG